VTVIVHGRVLHWTSGATQLESAPGEVVGTGAEIDDVEQRLDAAGEGAVSIELRWPRGVTLRDLSDVGATWSGAAAELALVPVSSFVADWSQRRVVISGATERPQLDHRSGMLTFSLRSDALRARGGRAYPPESWKGWPLVYYDAAGDLLFWALPIQSLRQPYPVVFGAPGVLKVFEESDDGGGGVASTWVERVFPAVPAFALSQTGDEDDVTYDQVLVTAGQCQATSVSLLCRATVDGAQQIMRDREGAYPITDAYDQRVNTTVRLVEIGAIVGADALQDAVLWTMGKSGTYWSAWDGGAAWAPPGRSGDVGWGLAELVTQIGTLTRTRIDRARMMAAGVHLDRYVLDTYLDSPTELQPWLDARILDAFPATVAESALGLYLVPVRWEATAQDAVDHLWVGERGVLVELAVMQPDEPPVDRIAVRWGRDLSDGRFLAEIMVDGVAEGSPVQARSQRPPSTRPASATSNVRIVELPDVWREETARLVAAYQAWRLRRGRVQLEVTLPAARAEALALGDVVLVTDRTNGLDASPCIIRTIRESDRPRRTIRVEQI
jgi:hypothetical protein